MSNQKVLVVDDSKVARKRLASLLKERAITVQEADNGEAGIDLLKEESVDALFLDLMMPGIDGHETLSRLKADSSIHLPPVVICTADNEAIGEHKSPFGDDVIATLSKPYTGFELEMVLNKIYPPPKLDSTPQALLNRRARSARVDVGERRETTAPHSHTAPTNSPRPVEPDRAAAEVASSPPQEASQLQDLLAGLHRLSQQVTALQARIDTLDAQKSITQEGTEQAIELSEPQLQRLVKLLAAELRASGLSSAQRDVPFNASVSRRASDDRFVDNVAHWWRQTLGVRPRS